MSQDRNSHSTLPADPSWLNIQGSTPMLIREDSMLQLWLAKLKLRHDVFSDEELIALKNLIPIDTGFRSQARWASIDSLLTKILQLCVFPKRYQRDVSGSSPCHQRFVFPVNRAMSLNHSDSLRRIILTDVFRQAGEDYLDNVLLIFFTFMVFYNLSTISSWGLKVLWDQLQKNDIDGAESLVISLSQWPIWSLGLISASPIVYACYRTAIAWNRLHAPEPKIWATQRKHCCYGRELAWSLLRVPTAQQEAAINSLLLKPSVFGRWWRWILPTPPCTKSGIQLMILLPLAISWNGRVTHTSERVGVRSSTRPATIFRLVHLLRKMALTESGLSQLQAIRALKQVAHGVSLGDLARLSEIALQPEIIREHVRAKIIALATLQNVNLLDQTTHWVLQRWAAKIYAIYQLWTLGAYEQIGWKLTIPLTTFKALKLYFSIHLYAILVQTIIQAIRCPDKPGFSFGTGYAPWASDYTEACFDELVKQFGFWPGQPASTLVNQIPNFHINSPYKLDLSGRGTNLDGLQVAEIMQGFNSYGIEVNYLNVAGSFGRLSSTEIDAMLTTFYPLDTLNMSGNTIGYHDNENIAALSNGLKRLTKLSSLDLSINNIGSTNSNNTVAFTGALQNLTSLLSLDLSQNLFGQSNSKGTELLGQSLGCLTKLSSLNLANNHIGKFDSSGIKSIGQGLHELKQLAFLDISRNYVGETDSTGTRALASGLVGLTGMTSLDLSSNMIGSTDSKGTEALGLSLKNLQRLSSLDLSVNSIGVTASRGTVEIGKSLKHLTTLTSLNLASNQIGKTNSNGTVALSQGLSSARELNLVDLSNNRIGNTTSEGVTAIAASIPRLSRLTTFYLHINHIGFTGFEGPIALARSLVYLSGLSSLDIGNNFIGKNNLSESLELGHALAHLTRLKVLGLSANYITTYQPSFSSIITALPDMPLLKVLGIQPQMPPLSIPVITELNHALQSTQVAGRIRPRINSVKSIEQYLASFPKNTTMLDLSDLLANTPLSVVSALCSGLKRFTNLQTLDLSNNEFFSNRDIGKKVSQCLTSVPTLSSLDLSNNQIGLNDYTSTVTLGKSITRLTRLSSLNLAFNSIGHQDYRGTQALGLGLGTISTLTFLNFSFNLIGRTSSNGTISLCNALGHHQNLATIDLSRNNIGSQNPQGTEALGNSLKCLTRLTFLDLSQNLIGKSSSKGTASLGPGLANLTNLSFLNLAQNIIGSSDTKGTVGLCQGLAHSTRLRFLDLSNLIGLHGPNGTLALASALVNLTNLTELTICNKKFPCTIGSTGPVGPDALMKVLPTLPKLKSLRFPGVRNIVWSQAAKGFATIHRNELEDVCKTELCFGDKNTTTTWQFTLHSPPPNIPESAVFTRPIGYWAESTDGYPPCVFPSGKTNILSTSKHGPQNALLPPCQHSASSQAYDPLNQLLRQSLVTGFALGARDEIANWIRSPRRQAVVRYSVLGLIAYSQGWDTTTALTSAGLALLTDYCKLDQRRAFQALLTLITLRLLREMARNPQTLWAGLLVAGVLSQLSGQVSYAAGRQTARFGQHLGASFFKPPPSMPEHESASDNPTLRFQPCAKTIDLLNC